VYSKITSARLYEQIVTQIEQSILDGKLRAGDQLPSEREMAEQFNVSRTAVREAVKALMEKGLIEIQVGRGTFVTARTDKAVRKSLGWFVKASDGNLQGDLVQVRNVLEPEIAAIAAQMASADDIANLQRAVNTMDASLEDAEAFIEADQGFHLALANATQNKLIPTLIDPIVDLLREQRKRIFLVEGGAQRGQFHHKRILDAIQSHDPEAARKAMQAHLAQVAEDSDAVPPADQ